MAWTKEQLNNIGIFELRSIARSVGVKSPTSLKKEKCIEEILKISSGENKPYLKQHNKGRPPLEIGIIKGIVDVFSPANNTAGFEADVFADQALIASGNIFASADGEIKTTSGLLEIEKGYGFLFENTFLKSNIFVSEQLIKKYSVLTGDEIQVLCKEISADGKMAAIDIKKVNNYETDKYLRLKEKLSLQKVEKPCDAVKGMDKISKGSKVGVAGNGSELNEKVLKIFNNCLEEKFLINANCLEENYIVHQNCKNLNVFENKKAIAREIELTFANFLNRAMLGQNLVLFISDITFLPKVLSENSILNDGVDAAALQKTKQLLACGKKFSGGGSLTVFAGLNQSIYKADIINSELGNICNLII